MNSFESKYIKIASKYLEERLHFVKEKRESKALNAEQKRSSSLLKFVDGIFK